MKPCDNPYLGSQLKSCITAGALGCKGCHCAAVEALTHHGMILTFTPNICNVFDNLHMMWMGIWIPHHAITTTCTGPDAVGSQLKAHTRILHHCWASNDVIVQWLRLVPIMEMVGL
jgi:hypothetical protein